MRQGRDLGLYLCKPRPLSAIEHGISVFGLISLDSKVQSLESQGIRMGNFVPKQRKRQIMESAYRQKSIVAKVVHIEFSKDYNWV